MRYPLILLTAFFAASALAQEPAADPACTNVRVALPTELTGWSDQMAVSAGVRPGDGATITVGKAALVSLHPAKHLALAPPPEKPATADSNGGTLTVSIAAAGKYSVALGGGAWIDLVRDGKAVASTAHGHGPKCTGVRKMVDFTLTPGTHTIALSGSTAASIAVMVAKL